MSPSRRKVKALTRDRESYRDDRIFWVGTDDRYATRQYLDFLRVPRVRKSPGWGGFFMGIKGLLKVVEQVDVFESVCGFVEVENEAHVSGDGQAPESF